MHDTRRNSVDEPLVSFLRALAETDYHFITPTPLTHERWLANRPGAIASTLRDAFGWNLPFEASLLPPELLQPLRQADMLSADADGRYRARLRVSSLAGRLYLHSAFPTVQADTIFFGPDTYRFATFIEQELRNEPARGGSRILDVGCGSGAGGLLAADRTESPRIVMNDINPRALRFAAVNAAAADHEIEPALGDALASSEGDYDLIVCNPPYLVDETARVYRDGGERLGRALAVRIVEESLGRLTAGGRLLLYTGVAIVDGRDPFIEEVRPTIEAAGLRCDYRELDPDVFGEELEGATYAIADRIAAVGLVVRGAA